MNWIVQRCSLEAGQRPCEKARLVARWDVLALLSARFACSERKEGGLNWTPATSYPRRSQWNGCCRCSRPGYHSTSDLDFALGLILMTFFWSSCGKFMLKGHWNLQGNHVRCSLCSVSAPLSPNDLHLSVDCPLDEYGFSIQWSFLFNQLYVKVLFQETRGKWVTSSCSICFGVFASRGSQSLL